MGRSIASPWLFFLHLFRKDSVHQLPPWWHIWGKWASNNKDKAPPNTCVELGTNLLKDSGRQLKPHHRWEKTPRGLILNTKVLPLISSLQSATSVMADGVVEEIGCLGLGDKHPKPSKGDEDGNDGVPIIKSRWPFPLCPVMTKEKKINFLSSQSLHLDMHTTTWRV